MLQLFLTVLLQLDLLSTCDLWNKNGDTKQMLRVLLPPNPKLIGAEKAVQGLADSSAPSTFCRSRMVEKCSF